VPPVDAAVGMEHRWGQREATDVAVYFVANSGTAGTGRVLDVSLTGAYLETLAPLRLLSVIYLKLDATAFTPGKAQCIAATVVRSDGRGVGLEWYESMAEMAKGQARLAILARDAVNESKSHSRRRQSTQLPVPAPSMGGRHDKSDPRARGHLKKGHYVR
jgi:PilZ domain